MGDKVKGDVTFPEDYGNDDLNGQTVTFEYTVKGIYSADPVALADMTDEQVNTVFGKAGLTTAQLRFLMSIYRPDSMSILLHLPRKMSRMDRHLRNI